MTLNPGSLLVDIAAAAIKKIRNRPKAVARRARKSARKAAANPPDEIDEPFFQTDKETPMLNGYKTYLGIAAALLGVVLGWLGIGETEASTLASQIVGALDQVLTVGGLALAAYGRAKAKPAA